MKKTNVTTVKCCSTRQKVYGIIALVGLFACGMMIGLIINGGRHTNVQKEHAPVVALEPETKTCEVIEKMLLKELAPESNMDSRDHEYNISIYRRLMKKGCLENIDKYNNLIQREIEILSAITDGVAQYENIKTCSEIENLLLQGLPYNSNDATDRILRAKIYANISERGCPENSQKYADLAAKELEIARALTDDRMRDDETIEVVETYNRLKMKQAAQDVINKVQKLTDPAIDFILQMEKIINE